MTLHILMNFIDGHIKGDSLVGDNCGFFERLLPLSHSFLQERSGPWRNTTECLRNSGERAVKWRHFTRPYIDRFSRLKDRRI